MFLLVGIVSRGTEFGNRGGALGVNGDWGRGDVGCGRGGGGFGGEKGTVKSVEGGDFAAEVRGEVGGGRLRDCKIGVDCEGEEKESVAWAGHVLSTVPGLVTRALEPCVGLYTWYLVIKRQMVDLKGVAVGVVWVPRGALAVLQLDIYRVRRRSSCYLDLCVL